MKLAIIGASFGQIALYKKAREMGLEVIGFAWNKGALRECLDCADRFYPISVVETDRIVDVCRQEKIDGVVSNGSELLAEVVAKISTALGLRGNDPEVIACAQDKFRVRMLTNKIVGLKRVEISIYGDEHARIVYPCVVKPISGSGKIGVSFVRSSSDLSDALKYAEISNGERLIVEQYIDGREISVESISYEGKHQVVQITDKVTTGAPHFVELAHHQPSTISEAAKQKIKSVIPHILDQIGFKNGATHIECKVLNDDEVALIEVNPRGGGGEIASTLVGLSTTCDYVRAMIDVALGCYIKHDIGQAAYAGIYYLCAQTAKWRIAFETAEENDWFVKKEIVNWDLHEATGNADRCGYLIYRHSKKVVL